MLKHLTLLLQLALVAYSGTYEFEYEDSLWDMRNRRADEVARIRIRVGRDWGTWGGWESCPNGTWVSAYRTKLDHGGGTALNSIEMYCSREQHKLKTIFYRPIKSKAGSAGTFTSLGYCSSHFNAVNLVWQKDQGFFGNDHGALEIYMRCPSYMKRRRDDGAGGWHAIPHVAHCPASSAVCALRTQVEDAGAGDTVGLNTLEFACCTVPGLTTAAPTTPRVTQDPNKCYFYRTIIVDGYVVPVRRCPGR